MSHIEFERSAFDGQKLYFQDWLTEQELKGAICLVHGLGEHSGRYSHWAGLLNQAGYSVISYDLRGHGKSGGQRGHILSFNDYLNDTDLLVKEARDRYPDAPQFLYGHSLGGIIVTNYVLRRKPKLTGVVVTALSNKTSLQEQKVKVLLSRILGSVVPKMSMSTGLIPSTISRDPEVEEKYINDPLVHHQASLSFAKSSLDAIAWSEQHASEWTLPVLFMHGEMDKLGYAEGSREFAAKIKGDCTIKIWPGMFHEVHNEPEKDQVFDYLRNWLDSHCQSKN
jgi:alpha-beta hydrolase superfamily lysophospholipase